MMEDVRDTAGASAPDPSAESLPVEESMQSPEVEAFASGTAAGESLPPVDTTDYKDRWLRTEAELQNFRRRAARDREESVRLTEDRLLLEYVSVLDDLERALAAMSSEQAAEPWAQGVALTAQRLRDVLTRNGVTVIDAVGKTFDPLFHEALLEIDAPEGIAPGQVAQVAVSGYRRGERALRAARVVVARAKAES
jgi:molecular chaperone GrpE